MKKPQAPPSDPNVLAVLHRSGKVWRGLIASAKAGKPAIVNSREFPADRWGRIEDWLREHQVSAVLCVLPSSAIICRNCTLPDASSAQLEQALRLQAEAHLLAIAPPHRVGLAVLPNAPGETSRTGLILAWPEAAAVEAPPIDRPVLYVPDIAAIAAILNGQRPSEPLMWLDRNDGSVALAITHTGGAMFRATREDATDQQNWLRGIARVVAESALSVGHTGAFVDATIRDAQVKSSAIESNQAALFLPREMIPVVASRLEGASTDPEWWTQFGLAAGAVLARTGPLASLTRYLDAPPVVKPSRVAAIATKLSRPRAAIVVALACVLVLMFGPLAIQAIRYGILRMRFADIHDKLVVATAAKRELAMYAALQRQNAWPMTKLLADITANAPVGIELEVIRIEGGKDFSLSGNSVGQAGKSATELVALMEDNLRKDGLFTDIQVKWGTNGTMGPYKFDLMGKVVNPYKDVRYGEDRDFAVKTYQVRLYGEPPDSSSRASNESDSATTVEEPQRIATSRQATPTENSSPEDEAESPASSNPRGTNGRRTGVGGGDDLRGAMPGESAEGGPPPSEAVPEPLTPEQINKMEPAELRDALRRVGSARRNLPASHEAQERLRKEFDLLMARLRENR